jgi:hypothetical protein
MTSYVGTRARSSSVHTDSPAPSLRSFVESISSGIFGSPSPFSRPTNPRAPTRVVILYVGQREPRHTESDVWTVLHDLFGVENPPADHLRSPCCDDGLPEVSQADLDAFLDEVQRMTRGRQSGRRRSPPGA